MREILRHEESQSERHKEFLSNLCCPALWDRGICLKQLALIGQQIIRSTRERGGEKGGPGISAKYCTGRRFVHWGIVRGGGVLAEVLLYWPGGGTGL